jgi:hypothetical protein
MIAEVQVRACRSAVPRAAFEARRRAQLPLEDTEVDARQYDDERAETGGFGAGAARVQARVRPHSHALLQQPGAAHSAGLAPAGWRVHKPSVPKWRDWSLGAMQPLAAPLRPRGRAWHSRLGLLARRAGGWQGGQRFAAFPCRALQAPDALPALPGDAADQPRRRGEPRAVLPTKSVLAGD